MAAVHSRHVGELFAGVIEERDWEYDVFLSGSAEATHVATAAAESAASGKADAVRDWRRGSAQSIPSLPRSGSRLDAGGFVARHRLSEAHDEWESIVIVANREAVGHSPAGSIAPHGPYRGCELALPDVPLIVEDLLLQAQELADVGVPNEALEEILVHVVALREGHE